MPVEPLRQGIVYRDTPVTLRQATRELDEMQYDMARIGEDLSVITTVKNLVNKWGVAILTAAVTAGLFNGTTSKFLSALLQAVSPH